MSTAALAAGPPPASAPERTLATQVTAAVVAAVGLLLVMFVNQGQMAEAWLNATLINATQIAPAEVFGASVIFLKGQAYSGFTVAAGCTATLLLVPFFFLTAGLLGFSRLSPRRCLTALVVVTVLINAANQGRMLLIAAQMRMLGGERGYEVSHVFLGTVVSTLGVLLAIVVFVAVLIGWRPRRRHALAGAA